MSGATHSWHPVDLTDPGDPPAPPSIGGLVYAGARHLFSGEPESGKTWAVLALCAEELRAGRTVMWLDTDNFGAHRIRERLDLLGLDEGEVGRFCLLRPDEPIATAELRKHVAELVAKVKPSLVVLDALDPALELHGFNPNDTADVQKFYRTILAQFETGGAASVVLDHVTKNRETRGRFSSGSQRKLGGVAVHLGFEPIEEAPLGRGRTGIVKIRTHKDWDGHLPRPTAATLTIDSNKATGLVAATFTLGKTDAAEWLPTALMEKVSRFVGACAEPPSRNEVETGVTGNAEFKRKAMDALVQFGFLREESGPNRARLYNFVRPYNKDMKLAEEAAE